VNQNLAPNSQSLTSLFSVGKLKKINKQRGLIGDIIARFEKRGYKLVGLKMVWPSLEMAEAHYADLSTKKFFPGLTQFFSSGPIVCMCWEGKDIIKQGRQMLGETQPLASKPGSIRGDFSIDLGRNICHGSDSPESAAHELKMWFPEGKSTLWS
jgi:nucleoside-diphosphate kinase